MSWLTEGPLASLLHRGDKGASQPSPGSYAMQGASIGSSAGPIGFAAGALGGWIYGRIQRGNQNNLRAMSTNQADAAGNELDAGVNWDTPDAGLGDPGGIDWPASGYGNVNGGGTMPNAAEGDGSAAPWYDDVSMGSSDELGLVPDYDNGATQRASHQEILDRLDAERNNQGGNYGISGMLANGGSVIFGSRGNDMNQVATLRRTPGY